MNPNLRSRKTRQAITFCIARLGKTMHPCRLGDTVGTNMTTMHPSVTLTEALHKLSKDLIISIDIRPNMMFTYR